MARKEFTPKTKEIIYQNAGGCCEACSKPLKRSETQYDHRIACGKFQEKLPDWINKPENGQALCSRCHSEKTNLLLGDKWEISKAKRQIKRAGKAKQSRGPKIQSRGFSKEYTRGFDGKVKKRKT